MSKAKVFINGVESPGFADVKVHGRALGGHHRAAVAEAMQARQIKTYLTEENLEVGRLVALGVDGQTAVPAKTEDEVIGTVVAVDRVNGLVAVAINSMTKMSFTIGIKDAPATAADVTRLGEEIERLRRR